MYSRERADTLGRVPDVPHLDVGGGHGEDQAGRGAVFDGNHVVGVSSQRDDLLARHQVPHLTGTVWRTFSFSFCHILVI